MQRITGVDVARGVAVLGMITAHVGPGGPEDPWPASLAQVADGRPAALFVLLSGVSVALISGGTHPAAGTRRVQARTRLLVRAFGVLGIGVVTLVLGAPIAVILPTYAVLFAVATALVGVRPHLLLAAAAGVAVVGPLVRELLGTWLALRPGSTYTGLLVGEYYPAVVWFAYVLVGMAVGRADLTAARTRRLLLGVGTGLAVVGRGTAAVATRVLADTGLEPLVTTEPHSSTTLEVVANTGVALAVLALCLVLGDRARAVVAPLAATGALALTAYTAHLVAIAALGPDVVWEPTAGTWLAFLAVTVGGCWLWRAAFGRGPLERLLHALAARASDVAPDALPPLAPPAAAGSTAAAWAGQPGAAWAGQPGAAWAGQPGATGPRDQP